MIPPIKIAPTWPVMVGDRKQKHPPTKYHSGVITVMAVAKNYVMVRHKGCAPFVMTEKEFRSLPEITS